jgi:hypothetical protein
VQRLGRNTELDRQSRDRLVVIDLRRHQRRHVRSANRARHHPQRSTQAPRRARVELRWADARWSTDLEMGRPSRPADTYT